MGRPRRARRDDPLVYTPAVSVLPSSLQRALRDRDARLTVLVVRLGALGDVLRTIPPVRLICRALPRSAIWWVVDDRWRVALEGHPDLAGTIAVPRRDWQRRVRSPAGWPSLLRSVRELRDRLRDLDPDLLLDFHGNLRSGIIGRLSGAPVRLGYAGHQAKEGNRWFTTHRVSAGSRRTPRIERNLDLVRAIGAPDGPLPLGDLPFAQAGAAAADRVVAETCGSSTAFAVINPGASVAQAYKKPPAALLSAAAVRLARRAVTPLVVWGPGEESDARQVVERAGDASVLAPPTDLPTLAALLGRGRLFVGGDSGPLHLACAVGCPVLALYGATDPMVNGPWGVPSRSVFPENRVYTGIKRIDRKGGAFAGISEEQVGRAVDDLLDELSEGVKS
jgi:ADP-heptose:LPS heptosyltransferase